MDYLGHQHRTKKLSPKIALYFKVLYKSKAMLPLIPYIAIFFQIFAHSELLLLLTSKANILVILISSFSNFLSLPFFPQKV